ncbi:S-adenosyl-L-methionine-dependent methyltransferase [Earliella scabrosa]|nr:S-adenosyl-L-methionine-dependent methyltransferase [Earliella scabrosa]
MTTLAHLRALYATIGTALDDIERVYRDHNLDLPSPDVPLYRTTLEPTDPAEKLGADPTVLKASNYLTAACAQLAHAVHNPFYILMEALSTYHLTAALQFLEASHTVEILRAAGAEGLHVSELAQRIDHVRSGSGANIRPLDPSQLAHILRLLATHQYIREVRPDVFTNNRFSSMLCSGRTPEQIREAPLSKYDGPNSIVPFVPMSTTEPFRTSTYISEFLLSPSPDSKYATPFNLAYQTEDSMYAFFERPENAIRFKQVSRAMSVARAAEGSGSIADAQVFPWSDLAPNSLVVDVGGGIGSVSVQIALAHPHLRLVVQDRAETVTRAGAIWGAQHKELFESKRITFQTQDFFEPQPAGLAPAVYILARIMHNWADEPCKKILSNLRAAAAPETNLIIVDQILPLACRTDPQATDGTTQTALVPPDSPLLPNLGKALVGGYHFDLTMMTMMNGKERTAQEFVELARSAGWKVVRAERAEGSLFGYTTCVPI